jgi:hypothetical protein
VRKKARGTADAEGSNDDVVVVKPVPRRSTRVKRTKKAQASDPISP